MKILILSPWGLSSGYSGPVVLMNRLFGQLSKDRDVDITVLYRQRDEHDAAPWAARAIPVIDARHTAFSALEQLIWVGKVSIFLLRRGAEFDIVHLQGLYLTTIVPALFLPKKVTLVGFPVLEAGDLAAPTSRIRRTIKRALQRRVLSRTDVAFALSHGLEKELATEGMARSAVIPIGNPVGEEFSSRLRPQRDDTDPSLINLVFVGKMGATKQPHLILDAMAKLQVRGASIRAVFAGPFESADYRERFESTLRKHGLEDSVECLGHVTDVASVLLAPRTGSDVFVLPSRAEGLPGALVEAMYAGMPCIVTDVGAMGDVIRESGAGLVVPPDADSLARAIGTVTEGPDAWTRYSATAHQFASTHFSSKEVARRYATALPDVPILTTPAGAPAAVGHKEEETSQ